MFIILHIFTVLLCFSHLLNKNASIYNNLPLPEHSFRMLNISDNDILETQQDVHYIHFSHMTLLTDM